MKAIEMLEIVAAAIDYRLPSDRQIRIFSLPYVIAAKIVAFQSRGRLLIERISAVANLQS